MIKDHAPEKLAQRRSSHQRVREQQHSSTTTPDREGHPSNDLFSFLNVE
jgi:hypothetical protein